jgi:hypothetical protein
VGTRGLPDIGWATEDAVWKIVDGPNAGVWRGVDAVVEGWRAWLSGWTVFRAQPLEFVELDERRVMVTARFTGRGKTSGIEISALSEIGVSILEFEGGLVSSLLLYTDQRRALADLGLTD